MAEAIPTNLSEIPITMDYLASQSKLYKAKVEFQGTDSQDILTYPKGSKFSEKCFATVVKCLGNNSKFSENLELCPLSELFHISLYLGSDTLLYYTVFDLLTVKTAVSILDLAYTTLGEKHHITNAVLHFCTKVTNVNLDRIITLYKTKRKSLRNLLRNTYRHPPSFDYAPGTSFRKIKSFIPTKLVLEERKPEICLCCNNQINRDNLELLSPMHCCQMMVHLECQVDLLKRRYVNCPACRTIFYEGKIDTEWRDMDSTLTIHHLDIKGVHPLPYRVRTNSWDHVKN